MRSLLDPALPAVALLLIYAANIALDEATDTNVGASSEPTVSMSISKNKSRLTIRGSVGSATHEAILRRTAATYFSGYDPVMAVRQDASAPPAWSLVTDTTLRVLSGTSSSSALIDEHLVMVRGIVTDAVA
jgi:hypothetical protein